MKATPSTTKESCDYLGYRDGAAGDSLDAHQVLVQQVGVQPLDCLDHELAEVLLVGVEQLGVERRLRALDQHISFGRRVVAVNHDLEAFELFETERQGLLVPLDDDLGVHAFLDETLGLLQELAREQRDRRSAVPHLVVLKISQRSIGYLGLGDVDQHLRGRVNYVQ